MSDAQEATLAVIHGLAGGLTEVEDAFRNAAGWAGCRERRPPTLAEILGYLIARRREAGAPEARPAFTPRTSRFLMRLAGDPYGFFGHTPARTRWPFDALRSPLASEDGPVLRFYYALALGATFRYRLPPALWAGLVRMLRAVFCLLALALGVLFTRDPALFGVVSGVFGFWLILSDGYVAERLHWAEALIEGNYALVEAEHRWGEGVAVAAAPECAEGDVLA